MAALPTEEAAKTLIVAHVLSRWAILPVGLLPPAKPGWAGGLLRVVPRSTVATVIAPRSAIVAGATIALASPRSPPPARPRSVHRTLGGITGDGYGATAKLTEVVVCVTSSHTGGDVHYDPAVSARCGKPV